MRHALSLPILASLSLVGCQSSYWVASADVNQVRQLQPGTPPEKIAILARSLQGAAPNAVYLRASMAQLDASSLRPVESSVWLHSPNKRGKMIGGSVLLGWSGALILGGIAMIGYGVSISKRDGLGAGLIAGASGFPLGIGIPLGIAGGVLLKRGLGPSDVIPPGQPDMTYVPALAGNP